MRAAARTARLAGRPQAMARRALSEGKKPAKLWGGAFGEATDKTMELFNDSLPFDKRLWAADLAGSKAYAAAIAEAGVIDADQMKTMQQGLADVRKEWAAGTFEEVEGDEDVHTANERRLGELVGNDIAGRLHTGRSRNDQVATDLRLWLRAEVHALRGLLRGLVEDARDVAHTDEAQGALMPGYTHLQRAQPVRYSHWLMSHAWAWTRDAERLDALWARSDRCPLGSGALAGHPFFDEDQRKKLSDQLKFRSPTNNSMDSVSDRDFAMEFTQWAALLGVHLSRWAEDQIIYGTKEFAFVSFGQRYSTGSSLMPQKRNPDALELLRGKAARLAGHQACLTSLLASCPSAYNKDLQEDKEPVFDAAHTLRVALEVARGVLTTTQIHPERMRAALEPSMLATDLAEHLVRKHDVPFRETHHVAGAAVRLAESEGTTLSGLSKAQLVTLHPAFENDTDADIVALWDFDRSAESRDAQGGTSLRAQKEQVAALSAWLAKTAQDGPAADAVALVTEP